MKKNLLELITKITILFRVMSFSLQDESVVENDITGERLKTPVVERSSLQEQANNFMDKNLLTLTTKMTVLF